MISWCARTTVRCKGKGQSESQGPGAPKRATRGSRLQVQRDRERERRAAARVSLIAHVCVRLRGVLNRGAPARYTARQSALQAAFIMAFMLTWSGSGPGPVSLALGRPYGSPALDASLVPSS